MEDLSIKLIDFGLAREINSMKKTSSKGDKDNKENFMGNQQKSNVKKNMLERRLTKHIVTRWYRSPEVILLQDYDFQLDMWSLGCIFSEMLGKLHKQNVHGPLFPGKSCYPISPTYKQIFDENI
jgi:mitogen-activated protein kinase 1/3